MYDQKNLASKNWALPPRLDLSKMFGKNLDLTVDTIVNTVWVGPFLALMLKVPSLFMFLGIYATGNILLGVVIGFGLTL